MDVAAGRDGRRFIAMAWALFWAATRWRRPIPPSSRLRRGVHLGSVSPVVTGAVIGWIRMIPTVEPTPNEAAAGATFD